jgi:tetratricopeptide (TPR) repeat protein
MSSARALAYDEDLRHRNPIPGLDNKRVVPLAEAARGVVGRALVDAAYKNVQAVVLPQGMSVEGAAAVHLYTMEVGVESPHRMLNKLLREADRTTLAPWLPYLKLLLTALAKLRRSEDGVLWRGVREDLEDVYRKRVGKTFVWWGLTSTSRSLDQVDPFAGKGATSRTVFVITRAGAVLANLSRFPAEDEVLLPPGCVFRVAGVRQNGRFEAMVHLVMMREGGLGTGAAAPSAILPATGARAFRQNQLLEVIRREEKNAAPSATLGGLLEEWEMVQLGDGREVGKTELFLEALRCDVTNEDAYEGLFQLLTSPDLVALFRGMQGAILDALQRATNCSHAYAALAMTLTDTGRVSLRDGRTLSQRQLLMEAIRCDNNHAMAYFNLATAIGPDEAVQLASGQRMDKRRLFVEAIRCNRRYAAAYFNLAAAVGAEGVELANARKFTARDLYVQAIRCDNNYAAAYFNLGAMLGAGQKVSLADGLMNEQGLYLEAIRCDKNCSYAYNNLGNALSKGEVVMLSGGRPMDQRKLNVEAIRCDKNNSAAYNNLGAALSRAEGVVLADKRQMCARELFVEAIRCDSSNADAFENLSEQTGYFESVPLADGRKMSWRQLKAEAARLRRGET